MRTCGSARLTKSSQSGRTLMEILVVVMMAAILMSAAIGDLRQLNDPLQNGAGQLASFITLARGKAISQTVAYHVTASSATKVVTSYGNTCSSTATTDPTMTLTLPQGATLASPTWTFCFSSRGLSDQDIILTLNDQSRTKTIEVMLGGGVRVH